MPSHDSTADDDLPRWFTWGAIGIGVLGLLLVVLVLSEARGWDLDTPCRSGETGQCVVYESGYVAAVDAGADEVTIRYDDHAATEKVLIWGEAEPGFGSRVKVRRWDGDVIAVRDLSSERDYRTLEWPTRVELIIGAIASTFFALVVLSYIASAVEWIRNRRVGSLPGRAASP